MAEELELEEIEGDRVGTPDFVFLPIGEPVPLKPSASAFDLDDPPSHPLAISERLGLLFLAHSEGFLVAKTKDVIRIAKEIKEKRAGLCVQESCVVDVQIGRVSILSLSTDSSTLAATIGRDIHFFSVHSLLDKDQRPMFSCSIGEGAIVKDFKWRKKAEKSFVILSSHSSLYHGYPDGNQPNNAMNNIDAVDWSVEGDFIAVAKEHTLSILSSNFEELHHMTLLFKSWPNDSECSIKVDSVNWVSDTSIIVGCVRVDGDGYLVQVITSGENGFTKISCMPVIYSFPDLFSGIDDAILPFGGGPYLLLSYLERWEVILASNKKAIEDHFLLLGWSRDKNIREVISLEFQNDKFPRIGLQENGNDNLILGLGIDRISLYEKITLLVGSNIEERSPYCILMCLTCEGKLIMFHTARISDNMDLPRTSIPVDGHEFSQEKTSAAISLESSLPTTLTLKDDVEGGISDAKLSQITAATPDIHSKEQGIQYLDTSKEGQGHIPSGRNEQNSIGSTGKVPSNNQQSVDSPHIRGSNSDVRGIDSSSYIPETRLSSPGKGIHTTVSLGNMSKEVSAARQAITNSANAITSDGIGKGLFDSTNTVGASFGSQSMGKYFAGSGTNSEAPILSFSTPILRDAQKKSEIGKEDKSSFSLRNISSAAQSSGGRSFNLNDSNKELPSSRFSSSNATLKEGHSSWVRMGSAKSMPEIHGSPILTHEGSSPARSPFSIRQPLADNNRISKSTQALNSEPEISDEFYNVKDMVKELDILLSSIEKKGGFKDACTVAHRSSVLALEEGLENIVEVFKGCKTKVEEQLIEIQHLQNKILQVSARQVYTEGIVKQASNNQYWDIWNQQKLRPEFDLKRKNILNTNQSLTNQLIELERHFNKLEINRFGETGRWRSSRRDFHSSSNTSRHNQSLYSVYNTLNSQLAAAQQLSECLSNQMSMLNLDKPSAKRLNVANELFESIGLTKEASVFPFSVKKHALTPDCTERVSPSTSKAFKEYSWRNTSSTLKSPEPETVRRRRDSLDRSLFSSEPQKTTVKRMTQERRMRASAEKTFKTAKVAFDAQMEEHAIVQAKSNQAHAFSSQSYTNKFESDACSPNKGIQEKPPKQASEPKDSSGSSHSVASKFQPTQVVQGSITHPSSSTMPSPSLSRSGQSNRFETFGPSNMASAGMTQFGRQWNTSTISETIPSPTPNKEASKHPSSGSTIRTVVDDEIRLFPGSTKQFAVSPESVPCISDENRISSPSSVSVSVAPSLSVPSASSKSSTTVTPSLPHGPFGRLTVDNKPIGETQQEASILPSSSAGDVSPRIEATTAPAPSFDDSVVNSKLEPANEVLDELVSKCEPTLPCASSTEKDENVDSDTKEGDEMEEEAPDMTGVLNFGGLGGFGVLGSTPPPSSAPTPNPFGGSFTAPSSLLAASPGELFRPASFTLPSAQPTNPSGGFSGFGQPAQVGAGQQALGSVLGSFGQSRQLGGSVQGFGFPSPGGGFSASPNTGGGFAGASKGGGFAAVASGGGFASVAPGGGFAAAPATGGGFAAAATGGGFAAAAPATGGGFSGFAAVAPSGAGFGAGQGGGGFTAGGFGSFGSNQGGGFSAFGGNSARPPASLLTQMRK